MKIRPLQRLFRVWTVLLVVVPALVIMSIYTVGQINEAKQQNLRMISQRVQAQEQLIDYWIAERADDVRRLSRSEAFRGADEEQIAHSLVLAQQGANFDSLSYIDKDGFFKRTTLVLGISHPSARGKPYFAAAQAGREYVSDVVIGRNSGQPVINFSAPVFDNTGNLQGLVLGSVRTATLQALLRGNWIGQSGEVFLVNREGTMLTEPRFAEVLIARGLIQGSSVMKFKITDDAFRNIRLGESGEATWIDYLGNKVLGAYFDVPERGWTLIGKINQAEVMAPIYSQLETMAAGTFLVVVLILPLATLITNRIRQPIDWLIRQSKLVETEDYARVGQERPPAGIPQELSVLCEAFVSMSRTTESTVELLRANETKLKSKVWEIQTVNAALEGEIKDRKRAEQRYQQLFNSINDAVLVFPFDCAGNPGTFSEANDVACERLGYTREEFLKLNIFDIDPYVTDSFRPWQRQGQILIETTHVTKAGREIPVEINASVLKSEQIIVSIARDITLRKRDQLALQRRLEMQELLAVISRKLISRPTGSIDQEISEVLQLAGESTGADRCVVFLDNPDGTFCNLSYYWCRERDERFAGFPSYAAADYAWERDRFGAIGQVSSPEDLPQEGKAAQQFMEDFGWKSMLVLPMISGPKGLGFLVLATVREAGTWDPEQIAWLKIVAELILNSVERKRIHDELSLRDKEYSELMEAVPDRLFEIDREGIFLSVRGLSGRFFVSSDEVIGKSVLAVYPDDVAQLLLDKVRETIATKKMTILEYDIVIDNDSFSREARIVSKQDGKALVVVRDITEEKRAEQKLAAAARLMEEGQRLAAFGVMATSIAHEINQPLNSIQISASGMVYAKNNQVRISQADMLKEFAWISEQAARIDGIIKNIRMFVQSDYSSREAVALQDVIDQVIKSVAGSSLFQEVSIKTNVGSALPPVLANPVHLQQVITNLIINAAQSVSRSVRSPKIIRINAWAEDTIILEVCDNGLGLPDDMATKIFEPFFSQRSDDQAMGLGLSIVQTIVSTHGGAVRAYNNAEGGATIRVSLPWLS